LPLPPFAIATVSQGRASRQCRLTVDTNRYAVPAHSAGHALLRTPSPDRRCLSLGDQRIARHASSDERHTESEDPDHPTPLLEQRKKARDHTIFLRFLALSPRAEAYSLQWETRRLTPHHHVRNMVALRDISPPEAVARAMDDACVSEAFSSEYIAKLFEQRARFTPEARAFHLTRRADRLEGRLAPPDLRMYHASTPTEPRATEEPTMMPERPTRPGVTPPLRDVDPPLNSVQLPCIAAQYGEWATHAAHKAWSPVDSLAGLLEGGVALSQRHRVK